MPAGQKPDQPRKPGLDASSPYENSYGTSRRAILLAAAGLTIVAVGTGCSMWRSDADKDKLESLGKVPEPPEMIRQAAVAYGLTPGKIQSYGIINNLLGTGSVEPPSIQRDQLLSQMKVRGVEQPNEFIDSPNTAIVLVETWIPAGARKGDPLDLTIRYASRNSPTGEQARSLRNGWLMPAQLRFTQMISGVPKTSDVLAEGTGPLLLRANFEGGDDPQQLLEGRILGGGRVVKEGKLDLRIRSEYRHVAISKSIAKAINLRFFYFDGTNRTGIANAKEDDLIEIEVPERYRNNVHRLMAVVGAIGTSTDLTKINERIQSLSRQLMEPTTAQDAAFQLEGIGQDGIPALLTAIGSPNPEIRFYAAEALGYLDNDEAIPALVELSREQHAFRFNTLQTLSGMKQRRAGDGLRQLFDEPSLETRSGAFDAMKRRGDSKSYLNGRRLTDIAMLYEIPSMGGPMVALSLKRNPDIVIFGGPVPVSIPEFIICGAGLTIVPDPSGGIQINRIVTGRDDQRLVVPPNVAGLCAGIAQVGGTYGDIVETLRVLAEKQGLGGQLAIDVLPKPLREYHRDGKDFDGNNLNPASIGPEPINPPEAETPERGWYDPRAWFGAKDK